MIDIKLETFITVAETKNFTKAANMLNMTQPAISHHIRLLEEYYGVKLIEKKNKIMELTEPGKILYKYAEEIRQISKIAKSQISNAEGFIKRYNIGATLTIGGYVLPRIIGKYKITNKNTDILLRVENTETIVGMLYSGEINLGVIEGPFDRKKLSHEKLKDDELVLAVASNHPLANRKAVALEEVLGERLILREKGSGTRRVFEDYLEEEGYNPKNINPYMEIGDITAIISLVESGLGVTVVSKEALKTYIKGKTIKALSFKKKKIMREFNFIYLKDSELEFIEDFISFCRAEEGEKV